MRQTIFFVLLSLVSFPLFSQGKGSYNIELWGSAATGENNPFWLVNQNWGIVPVDADNLYLRGSVFHEYTLNKDWSFEAGIDIVGATSSAYGNPWIQQLFGRVNWKIWRLDIGPREDYTSYLNPRLSSGDFVKSNNSRPLPEIKASIPDFLQVPYTKGNMYIKGDFAAGYYLDSQWKENTAFPRNKDYTKNLFSHHKSIYFRFGDIETKNKMQFMLGMDHVAQWGGELHKYKKNFTTGQWQYEVQAQPHGIDDFFRIAIAKEGSSSASSADQVFVSGSQWGIYTFKYDYKLKNDARLSAYIQHFFEDGTGMVFENYPDNLYGLEFQSKKKSFFSGLVLEYIYMKQHTGPIHFNLLMDDEHKSKDINKGYGNDNYYNNVDYVQGPSYFGRTLGTPLFLSPVYNNDGEVNFKNTRIISFHLGVEGYFHPQFRYRLLLTAGRGWGRYYIPFRVVKEGFASELKIDYTSKQIKGLNFELSVGYDKGSFFGGDTFGAGLTLRKRGIILSK
jgi:hypothetical protein